MTEIGVIKKNIVVVFLPVNVPRQKKISYINEIQFENNNACVNSF